MTEMLPIIILTLIIVVALASSVKIAGESERFAVFILGRFHSFKGPGLVLVAPGTHKVHRLRIGDTGLVKSSRLVQFGETDVPISDIGSLKVGQSVRIDNFDGVEPRIAAASTRAEVICPKCGHTYNSG